MERFNAINPEELKDNVFKLIGKDWMLVTAGGPDGYNMMTASWGGLGVLWNRRVSYIVIRPTRYTYEYIEKSERYTLSFFGEGHRETLNLCGTNSGRDIDKMRVDGLTPLNDGADAVFYAEARLVLVCRKLYFQDIDPANFLDPSIDKNYPQKDYHRLYVGEIEKCLTRKV